MTRWVATSRVRPEHPSRVERAAASFARGVTRVSWLRRFLLWRPIASAGYAIATACAYAWAWVLFGRHEVHAGLHLFRELPRWSFGRGGTTIGGIYLTHDVLGDGVVEHEKVHRDQWRYYGLAFPVLYLAAGKVAKTNRFEVDAGLKRAGYDD